MKKFYAFTACVAVLSFISCNKQEAIKSDEQASPIVITATYEQPISNSDTKVSISESGSSFSLIWDGTETMKVGNSEGTSCTDFSTTSSGSTTATFTGLSLPSATGATVSYIGIVSSFGSTTADKIRGAVKYEQAYSSSSVANYSFLAARADGCTVGTLKDFSFKTLNAFLKLSLIKGDPAVGAAHTYDKMYVTNIVVESVNDEQISGKFAVSKTGSGWEDAYVVDDKIDASDKKSSVVLDCTNGGAVKGELLSAVAKQFYIAIGFGTYAKGLKVTVNVRNDAGDTGEMIGYISKNTSYDVDRNTIIVMPNLTVRPSDTTSEIICWSENWTGATTATSADDSAKPSTCGTTGTYVYGGGSVTYSESANSVYVRDDTYAGGTAPELMLTKAQTWTISGIPTAGATTLTFTYKSNNTKSSVALSGADKATISGSSKSYTITTGGDATINLQFSCSGNTRLDDLVIVVKD